MIKKYTILVLPPVAALLFFSSYILSRGDEAMPSHQAKAARGNACFEQVLIINKNSVVFLQIPTEAFQSLVSDDMALAEQLIEIISDFEYYAGKIAPLLEQKGIDIKFGYWKKIRFELADGKIEEIDVNPRLVCGMALFAKGQAPLMTSASTPDYFSIREIINNYFNLKIK